MSDLTITLLRLGYLALLWVLVLTSIGVLRRDLYGTRITDRRRNAKALQPAGVAAAQPTSARRQSRPTGPSRLVVTRGPLRGTIVPLGSSAVLLGRAPSCTLVLDDDYSSSRHPRIYPHAGHGVRGELGYT